MVKIELVNTSLTKTKGVANYCRICFHHP